MISDPPSELAREAERYLAKPEARAVPYALFKQLLEEAPVCPAGNGVWLVTRYAVGTAVLRDTQRFSRARAAHEHIHVEGAAAEIFKAKLMTNDDPVHGRLRRLVASTFSPAGIRRWEPRIAAIADDLLDGLEPLGSAEIVTQYGYPLPERVICEMLGAPHSDHALFKAWSKELIEVPPGGDIIGQRRRATQALNEFADYIRRLVTERRQDPRDDLVGRLIAADEGGSHLAEHELIAITYELIVAGHETTAKLIPNGLYHLLHNPDQLQLLRDDPAKIAGAVEEVLRFESSAHMSLPRQALEDVELDGVAIPKGGTVVVVVGAANRDPEVFSDPDRFDVTRDPNDHLAFGIGNHFCLGYALARTEARIAYERLLGRFPKLELLQDTLEYECTSMTRGPVELRVGWAS
jgi:cytochrome P450